MSYAELHAKTNFSFLEGASHPDELVMRAAELGYAALAVTDRNSLAGVVRAHVAAKQAGVKVLVGAEITPGDAPAVVLLAMDRGGYGRLARLITRGRLRADKGSCRLVFADVAEHSGGLLALVVPPREGILGVAQVQAYREVFGQRCYLLAELHRGPADSARLERLKALAWQARVPLVAAGDVHYHCAKRQALADVLAATRLGCTVAEAGEHLFPNAQRHLRAVAEMEALFAAAPEAVHRTVEVAEQIRFSLDQLRYEYPEELAPPGLTPLEYLARLTWEGARWRYPDGIPEKVQRLLEHELKLIGELRYEAYFLTVWDLVQAARQRGILCQGRGSAANSAVCYCLGITSVDPDRMDLLFERFVSRQRNEAPDIDVDFEHQRREEVIQYLYQKYGRERAGMTAEVITYRPRLAVREVGKALGLSLDRVDRLAKKIEHFHHEPDLAQRCREAGLDPESPLGKRLVWLVEQLVGFPRHLSQHTGGMVITRGPLCELVPLENAAMPDRTVIQWNKDDLDELGILKVDCLALGMLSAIHRTLDLVKQHGGPAVDLARIPEGDPRVYAMIRRADTMGVFQIESRAQMAMLPRLRPQCFYDLVIEVAIVRPGPIQGDMVHPYLRRRNGEEPVTYPSPEIRQVLEKTLGVPLFQEQAMRLAMVAAGFTPGEADQLRRAMGAWRRPGLIDQFRKKLVEGMRARGLSEEYATAVFRQIRGFGEYGFPESHAASFALLVYASAWLKYHYPAAFIAGLLNSQPMGFYAPAQLVRDARQHGVQVLPADVNHSHWDCTLEGSYGTEGGRPGRPALRLGFRMVAGLSEAHVARIAAARANGPFVSMDDFARRTGLPRWVILRLARAGAFGSLRFDRRQALWHALDQHPEVLPLFDRAGAGDTAQSNPPEAEHTDSPPAPPLPPSVPLPRMSEAQEVLADYATTGLSLRAHPMQFLRTGLARMGVVPARRLASCSHGKPVRIAGIVLVRQRPATARGITFMTVEDETGIANLVVRPQVWQQHRQAALGATIVLAQGRVERRGQVIHVLVRRLEDLSSRLADLTPQSRDFC